MKNFNIMEEKFKVYKDSLEVDDEAKESFIDLKRLNGGFQVYKLSNENDDRINIVKLFSNRFMISISIVTCIIYMFIACLLITYK